MIDVDVGAEQAIGYLDVRMSNMCPISVDRTGKMSVSAVRFIGHSPSKMGLRSPSESRSNGCQRING
jgi:hypothetical protein